MSTLRVDNITDLGDDPVVTAGRFTSDVLPAGSVLQVVSTTKTDTFTTTSTTFTDVTGLSATITPTSTSSKILVLATIDVKGKETFNSAMCRLLRDSTPIAVSDAAGSRRQSAAMITGSVDSMFFVPVNHLDSPATTSPVTYKWQVENNVGGQTIYVNRTITDTDSTQWGRGVSTITLMEIAG